MQMLRLLPFLLFASPVLAAPPKVVTDIPPVQSLAAAVMGDLGVPDLLLDKGADPHHFQLRPSQATALSKADLVLWVGPDLTPWLQRALNGIGPEGESIELIEAPGTYRRKFDHAGHAHHHEADGEADAPETGHEDLDLAGDVDPHAWLEPENARVWVLRIAGELAELDPADAMTYEANANAALESITQAEAEARALLAPVGDAKLMVFHDAYGYFAEHYGLDIVGAISAGDAADPGAARLSALKSQISDEGIACIIPEAQHEPAYVKALVEGTTARIGRPLDPSGSTLEPGPALYPTLLTGLARAIADCVTGN